MFYVHSVISCDNSHHCSHVNLSDVGDYQHHCCIHNKVNTTQNQLWTMPVQWKHTRDHSGRGLPINNISRVLTSFSLNDPDIHISAPSIGPATPHPNSQFEELISANRRMSISKYIFSMNGIHLAFLT